MAKIKTIEEKYQEMSEREHILERSGMWIGSTKEEEARDCYNYGFVTTIIHELRHLAQQNPYLPEDVLQQEDEDEEEDAEMFARNFCDDHPLIALI